MQRETSRQWDLVIVGASFAGAACALAASAYGLRVCVLERKRDPGIKLHTTGIIVKEAAERTWLGRLPAALVHRVDGVRLYSPALRRLDLRAPDYYFLTTDTPSVMRWLAAQLRAQGVDLRLGTPFQRARRDGAGWHVDGIGNARYVVGADGAKSRVAECAGLDRIDDYLYGVEHEFPGATLREPGALHCFIGKRFAPGYIGWAAQNPGGVQLGLARRHRGPGTPVPDIAGFRAHVGEMLGLEPGMTPGAIRAGLIPCGGAVRRLAADGAILTGDAAGIVSPVTAGGIHSAWQHGWGVGSAIARHLRHGGPAPEAVAAAIAPRYRAKRLLRRAFDALQADWPFDLLLHTAPLRRAAEHVYFHRRGAPRADGIEAGARERTP